MGKEEAKYKKEMSSILTVDFRLKGFLGQLEMMTGQPRDFFWPFK
jgi:hypothetical protein